MTIAPRIPMMIYLGKPGSGEQTPIDVSGVFTDQGVVSERTVGKPVGQRTVIRIENSDRHVFELYFKTPTVPSPSKDSEMVVVPRVESV